MDHGDVVAVITVTVCTTILGQGLSKIQLGGHIDGQQQGKGHVVLLEALQSVIQTFDFVFGRIGWIGNEKIVLGYRLVAHVAIEISLFVHHVLVAHTMDRVCCRKTSVLERAFHFLERNKGFVAYCCLLIDFCKA